MPEMSKEEFLKKLLNQYEATVTTLFTYPEQWRKFLSTSCFNYKLRFDQQVLLYAQRPEATIIATHDQWYKLYRPVKSKMKAIYVFEVEGGKNNRYTRYYEESATRELRNSKPIPFWQMKRGYKRIVTDALKAEFEDFSSIGIDIKFASFEQEIILAAETIANNEIEGYYDYILEDIEYTQLEELDNDTIIDTFNSIVTNSVAYAMLSRLGINADNVIDPSVFDDIRKFNSESTLSIVGKATQQITQTGLNVIAKAIKQFEREVQNDRTRVQSDDNRRKARIQHGVVREQPTVGSSPGRRAERGNSGDVSRQDQQPLVSVQRGAEGLRSDVRDPGGRGTGNRNLFDGEERVSRIGEIPDVRENAVFGNTEQALQRPQEGMYRNGRKAYGTDEQSRGDNLGASEERLDDLRSGEGESQEESTGDSSQRNGLRLNNTEQQAEIEDDSTSASSMPDNSSTESSKSFAQQVDDVLSGNAGRYDDLKVCDTPQILIDIGCRQLPIFYTQRHLRDALKTKGNTGESIHHHGLTLEQIKNIPFELEDPVLVYDSLSRQDSIIVVTSRLDNDNSPIIAVIRPNGKAKYNLEVVDSNFLLSVHGRENFANQIERAVNDDKILYINVKKVKNCSVCLGYNCPRA